MSRFFLFCIGALLLVHPGFAQSGASAEAADAAGVAKDGPAVLVLAPDRGFLGNEKARDVMADVQAHVPNAALTFATADDPAAPLADALSRLNTENGVRVLPLFLSTHHALYRSARDAMPSVDAGVTWAAPFGDSYLAEEILFDRVEALTNRSGSESLVVVGYGAETEADANGIRADLQPMVDRAVQKYGLTSGRVAVQYGRTADEATSRAAMKAVADTVRAHAESADRVLVVPFNLGTEYTSMMAAWTWMRRALGPVDGAVLGGEGVVPHANVARWIRHATTRARPLDREDVAVIAIPHGSTYTWNQTMRDGLAPLTDDYRIAEAFSMVDPVVIERAVRTLEDEGYAAAVVVRIFSLESSFQEKAEYVLGLQRNYRGGMGGRFPHRIRTHLQLTTLGGLEASPHFAKGLLDRAMAISTDPSEETVILLGHGTGSDRMNDHWMKNLQTLADTMRAHGGDAFRDIHVHTWREDWPEKRKTTVPEIRAMVEEAADTGTALVIPARTTAQGRASQYLDGLDYRYGKGFAPHPQFEAWLREQIETGITHLQTAPTREADDSVMTDAGVE